MKNAHYFAGFTEGVMAFRCPGPHAIPRRHPSGSTPEGRDCFLGVAAGLERVSEILSRSGPHGGERAETMPPDGILSNNPDRGILTN